MIQLYLYFFNISKNTSYYEEEIGEEYTPNYEEKDFFQESEEGSQEKQLVNEEKDLSLDDLSIDSFNNFQEEDFNLESIDNITSFENKKDKEYVEKKNKKSKKNKKRDKEINESNIKDIRKEKKEKDIIKKLEMLESRKEKKENNLMIYSIVGIVVLLGIVIGVIILYNNKNNNPEGLPTPSNPGGNPGGGTKPEGGEDPHKKPKPDEKPKGGEGSGKKPEGGKNPDPKPVNPSPPSKPEEEQKGNDFKKRYNAEYKKSIDTLITEFKKILEKFNEKNQTAKKFSSDIKVEQDVVDDLTKQMKELAKKSKTYEKNELVKNNQDQIEKIKDFLGKETEFDLMVEKLQPFLKNLHQEVLEKIKNTMNKIFIIGDKRLFIRNIDSNNKNIFEIYILNKDDDTILNAFLLSEQNIETYYETFAFMYVFGESNKDDFKFGDTDFFDKLFELYDQKYVENNNNFHSNEQGRIIEMLKVLQNPTREQVNILLGKDIFKFLNKKNKTSKNNREEIIIEKKEADDNISTFSYMSPSDIDKQYQEQSKEFITKASEFFNIFIEKNNPNNPSSNKQQFFYLENLDEKLYYDDGTKLKFDSINLIFEKRSVVAVIETVIPIIFSEELQESKEDKKGIEELIKTNKEELIKDCKNNDIISISGSFDKEENFDTKKNPSNADNVDSDGSQDENDGDD